MVVDAPSHPVHDLVVSGSRRRRPPAGPAPIARPIFRSGRVYLGCTVALVAAWLLALEIESVSHAIQQVDRRVTAWIVAHRSRSVADGVAELASATSVWVWRVVRWTTLGVLLASRRWRHLVAYVAILLVVSGSTNLIVDVAQREVPAAAWPIDRVDPLTHPARAVVDIGLSAVGAMYTLAPRGRARNRLKWAVAGFMLVVVAARQYLALEHPTDAIAALVLGMAVPVVLFRYLTPGDTFPVRWTTSADRCDLDPATATAITTALDVQLGVAVRRIELLRPTGSSGSTPMRLVVDGGHDADGTASVTLFGKLYSRAHLRSDRWYKVARAVLYGRLEDEVPFGDLRHLVEHEDYMLRVAAAAGLPVPVTHGVIEVARGREYLLLMEWLPEARQLDRVTVTPDLADQAFAAIATMWQAGMAHRDIKPANLVVSDGSLRVVDLSFAEIQASAWRLAVDLGNMILCLALFAPSPSLVLDVARRRFADDELAEALAATRSVTIPAQLRVLLKRRPEVLPACRTLVPFHAPIRVQRWSVARIGLTAIVVIAAASGIVLLAYDVASRPGL